MKKYVLYVLAVGFIKKNNVLTTYMPNFKSQGFKIKEKYVIVLSISSVHLLFKVTWWFLASDGSEIQASVEDFRPVN